jgi:hypothetical protein
MARKIATVVISGGRDDGKTFILKEMPASQTEKWATRAFLAIARSGSSAIKDALNFDFDEANWQSKATICEVATHGISIFGAMDFKEAEPLLDEMFSCITLMPDPSKPMVTRSLIEDDIEDVTTRLTLRKEIFKLHVDFFTAAAA